MTKILIMLVIQQWWHIIVRFLLEQYIQKIDDKAISSLICNWIIWVGVGSVFVSNFFLPPNSRYNEDNCEMLIRIHHSFLKHQYHNKLLLPRELSSFTVCLISIYLQSLSGMYPAILNILKTSYVALIYPSN